MKKITKFKAVFFVFTIAALVALINACNKDKAIPAPAATTIAVIPAEQNKPLTQLLTVANMHTLSDGTNIVVFNENAEVFHTQDASLLALLHQALSTNTKVKVTFDPWQASITKVAAATAEELAGLHSKQIVRSPGTAMNINLETMDATLLDDAEKMGVINTSLPSGLTNVVPDMGTAQLMFNYLAKQCCQLPGPYAIDYCISFQYAEDGCYARAQKMCYILNTRYHYDTHKIFSFANAGSDELCVKAEKWGGCCVNWWYHVAPLVNIKTGAGTKAYVFDPAMFDQPVLLSAWLHAQQNPSCSGGSNPHVSMINIQPTTSYSPADYSGLTFDTDPTFSNTNSTLVNYSGLSTCP